MIRCIGFCRFELIEFIEQNSEKRNDLVLVNFVPVEQCVNLHFIADATVAFLCRCPVGIVRNVLYLDCNSKVKRIDP